MKTLLGTVLAISVFVATAFAVDTRFKTRLIKSATLTIHVREGVFLTIRSFTQDTDTGQRGVIVAGIFPPTPTPIPTATPTPTPTCTPTPCPVTPTPTPSPTPVPTPTPIFGTVHTASISDVSAAISEEFIKPIVIAGPAVLTIDPVQGATLSITYRKSLQPIQPTPTVTAGSTSTATSASTSLSSTTKSVGSSTTSSQHVIETESLLSDEDDTFSTPTPTPTATPTPTPKSRASRVTPTPTATPSVTPRPTP